MKGYAETIIATNKTNPVLMKIARRERWIKPFAKKMTAEYTAKVKELRFENFSWPICLQAKMTKCCSVLVTGLTQPPSP